MTTTQEVSTRNANYIDVDGVRTYYEKTGNGEPLILRLYGRGRSDLRGSAGTCRRRRQRRHRGHGGHG